MSVVSAQGFYDHQILGLRIFVTIIFQNLHPTGSLRNKKVSILKLKLKVLQSSLPLHQVTQNENEMENSFVIGHYNNST